jgi:aminocarboxymuconate-semialdehyde decarboxylase
MSESEEIHPASPGGAPRGPLNRRAVLALGGAVAVGGGIAIRHSDSAVARSTPSGGPGHLAGTSDDRTPITTDRTDATAPASGTRPPTDTIDIHGHAVTPAVEAVLSARGSRMLDGRPLPRWSARAALDFLDSRGIAAQVLSSPDPALALAPRSQHRRLARAINDDLAAVVEEHPGRFGALAVLPLSAGPIAAVREIGRALDRLHLDGILLPTNIGGDYLGAPRFLPVLAELSRREVPVLVHPASPLSQDWPETTGAPAEALEHAFESVRCAANMLYSGVFALHGGLRLIMARGGGGLPFLSDRVALPDQVLRADLFVEPLRSLGFDTAQAHGPAAMAAARAFVSGPGQLYYGSDWPLISDPPGPADLVDVLPSREAASAAGAAAMAAFPRLAGAMRRG